MRKHPRCAASIAAILLALASIGCSYDFDNPVDPEAPGYAGYRIIEDPADIAAERAWATPSDGSADPVFLASRVLDAAAYQLQVASTEDFSGTLLFDEDAAGSNEIAVPGLVEDLAEGSTYYWRVRASTGVWGAWSPAKSFVAKRITGFSIEGGSRRGAPGTAIPAPGFAISPADATCPMIRWTSSDPSAVGVDARGKLRFITPGIVAVITGTTADGGFAGSFVASTLLSSPLPEIIAGSEASFSPNISSICTDGRNMYICDSTNHDMRVMDLTTREIRRLVGQTGVAGFANGSATEATFSNFGGICTDGTFLYVGDFDPSTSLIRKIEIASGSTSTFAGSIGTAGTTDGFGQAATIDHPRGMCTDGESIYFVQSMQIRRIIISTAQVTTLWRGSSLPGMSSGDDLISICTDGKALYITSCGNFDRVFSLDLETGRETALSNSGSEMEAVDGVGVAASFAHPIDGIFTDGRSLFIPEDTTNPSYGPWTWSLRKIDLATGAVGTIMGPSSEYSFSAICGAGAYLYLTSGSSIIRILLD